MIYSPYSTNASHKCLIHYKCLYRVSDSIVETLEWGRVGHRENDVHWEGQHDRKEVRQ